MNNNSNLCVCVKGKIKVKIIEMVYQEIAEFPVRCGEFRSNWVRVEKRVLFIVEKLCQCGSERGGEICGG